MNPPPDVGPRGLRFETVAVLCVAIGGAGLFLGRLGASAPRPPLLADTHLSVVKPTPSVIVAVRDLARLEGAEFHMEKVLDLSDQQRRLFGLVQAEDKLLLVAAGDVVAGVDLKDLKDDAIVVDAERRSARLRVPAPNVLSSRLDNDRTYVHTRSTDLLAQRRESLEGEARREAERAIVSAAIEGGLLGRAETNVRRTLEALLRSLGFVEVRVEFVKG